MHRFENIAHPEEKGKEKGVLQKKIDNNTLKFF